MLVLLQNSPNAANAVAAPSPYLSGVKGPGSGRACQKLSRDVIILIDTRGCSGANCVGSHFVTAFRDHNVVNRSGNDRARAWSVGPQREIPPADRRGSSARQRLLERGCRTLVLSGFPSAHI